MLKKWAKYPLELVNEIASSGKDLDLVQFILENVDPHSYIWEDIWVGNLTPIHLASKFGFASVVKKMFLKSETPLNISNENGWTPILLGARNGHLDVVKFFVNLTNDPNAPDIYTNPLGG